MVIMKKSSAAKFTKKHESHERIVAVTARAIRRSGYEGTGIANIMKEAGLTHGGFYAHFPSRDALLAEAADRAGAESVALATAVAGSAPAGQELAALVRSYLSEQHLSAIEQGCPIAALGSEMPRQSNEVRHAATRRIQQMLELVENYSPSDENRSSHEYALTTLSTLVGTLVLARAVDDTSLSDALLNATLKQFKVSA